LEDYNEVASTPLGQPPAPRGRRWFLIGVLTFAFMLALGVGALIGSTQAAALASGNTSNSQTLAAAQGSSNSDQALAATPGVRGQCDALTVSSVSGSTIVAKTASGSSVTIHTTASTQYTQAGKTVAASAVTVGSRIHVTGTHNSDGSITATRVDIG
jgi:hypothetical protein